MYTYVCGCVCVGGGGAGVVRVCLGMCGYVYVCVYGGWVTVFVYPYQTLLATCMYCK